jgi:hypothetical protein
MKSRKLVAFALVFVLAAPAVLIALRVLIPREEPVARRARSVVVFQNAPGWSGGRTCPVSKDARCDSEWTHESGQLVTVFVFDVPDARAIAGFEERLAADVVKRGGVVDRFTQGGLRLMRYLQEVEGHAQINYVLVAPDESALFHISSLVPFEQQRDADERIRTLLEHAAWTPR